MYEPSEIEDSEYLSNCSSSPLFGAEELADTGMLNYDTFKLIPFTND